MPSDRFGGGDGGPGADDDPYLSDPPPVGAADPGPEHGDMAVGAVWLPPSNPVVGSDGLAVADRPPPICSYDYRDHIGRLIVCGSALDAQLACEVCAGRRCYEHCRSVDHFPDAAVYTDGGMRDGYLFKVVSVAGGKTWHWHVRRPGPGGLVIAYGSHIDCEEALADCFAAQLRPLCSPETHRHVRFAAVAAGDAGEADGWAYEMERWAGEDPFDFAVGLAHTGDPVRRRVSNALQAVILNSHATWEKLRARPDEAGEPHEVAWQIRRTELCVLIAELDKVLP